MRISSLLAVLCLMVGTSCTSDDSHEHTHSPTTTASEAVVANSVTWHETIQPLVQRTCARCHSEVGVAPSDLTDYHTAASLASVIDAYVSQGLMPPPSSDPECQPYHESDRVFLSADERQLFADWAEQGAPLGSPEDAPVAVEQDLRLKNADLTIKIAEPYVPSYDEAGDKYACFVLETGRTDKFYMNGIQALIDQDSIVHHLFLFADKDGNAKDRYGNNGFDCMSSEKNPELDDVWNDWKLVSSWAPGGSPIDFGENMGLPIEPGQVLVLQMHYYRSSPEADGLADQSGFLMRTSDSVEYELEYTGVGDDKFTIPAGDDNYTYHYDWTLPPRSNPEYDLLVVSPHMHKLGTYARSWIDHVDGSRSCLYEGQFDFDNQMFYTFENPVRWAPGDVINLDCTWNNSTSNPELVFNPPRDIVYGEGTSAEMCFLALYIIRAN